MPDITVDLNLPQDLYEGFCAFYDVLIKHPADKDLVITDAHSGGTVVYQFNSRDDQHYISLDDDGESLLPEDTTEAVLDIFHHFQYGSDDDRIHLEFILNQSAWA